ncbi:MAG: thiamine pyrophosphate-dependent enzyme [Pseudomonadota bacterium]
MAEPTPSTSQNAAQALVATLVAAGIDTAFCVPGESYLAVLDALYDAAGRLRLITCRQEGGAATMAEAHGRLTNKPGICFVTRGPGATNAAIGVHNAKQNATPMVLFIGQVARADQGREAFQEVDFEAMFAPLAKWAVEVRSSARMVEIAARALHVASAGRPGPVVVSLPEDMLSEPCPALARPPAPVAPAVPSPDAMARCLALLNAATRPIAIVGGSSWTPASAARFTRFCEDGKIPILAAFRRQSLIDNRSPAYAGVLGLGPDPKLIARVHGADLVLAVGTRLGDIVTQGYSLFEGAARAQKLIHVTPDETDLGRVFAPALGLACRADDFIDALPPLSPREEREAPFSAARADYEAYSQAAPEGLDLDPAAVFRHLRSRLADEAIITNGAGNFAIWLHRYFPYHGYNTQLGPISGAMGYALPAALAAKLACPDRQVVAVAGDGELMMTVQELASAAQYGLKVIVLVFNNGMFGTIRMHQAKTYPGRVSGTRLTNPDFAALARAHGLFGARVERTQDFAEALARGLAAPHAALIELVCAPQQITPTMRLTDAPED